MEIVIKRIFCGCKYTIGKLFVDGNYLCDTLEPAVSADSYPAIPLGSYTVNLVWSPKFRNYMLRLEVPSRSGILIHAGNNRLDTQGCILLGENKMVGCVLNSRKYVDCLRSLVAIDMHSRNKKVIVKVLNI